MRIAAQVQTDAGRQVASGGIAADADARGIGTDLIGVVESPEGGGQGVIMSGRKGVFRREPVIHRQNPPAVERRQPSAMTVVSLQIADHPPAAMEIDQQGTGRHGLGRLIEPRADDTGGTGNLKVPRLDLRG